MDDRQKLKLEMEIEVSLKQSESIKRLVDVLYSDIISNNANIFMSGETAQICFQGTSMPRQEVIDVLREFDDSVKDKPVKREETKKEVDGETPEKKEIHKEYRFNRNRLKSKERLKLEDVPILKEFADKASSYEEFIQMILDYVKLKNRKRDLYIKIIEVTIELLKEEDYVLFSQIRDKINEENEILTEKDYKCLAATFSYRNIKKFIETTMLIARCSNYDFSSKSFPCNEEDSTEEEKDEITHKALYEILKTVDNQKDKLDKVTYILSQMGINDELARKVILLGITTEVDSNKNFWKEVARELKVDKIEIEAKVSSQINEFFENNGEGLIKAFDFIQLLKRNIC